MYDTLWDAVTRRTPKARINTGKFFRICKVFSKGAEDDEIDMRVGKDNIPERLKKLPGY
jgi:hypothetical protein